MSTERYHPWEPFFICKCGKAFPAPFADRFHIHLEVCPTCAAPKSEWKGPVRGRWVGTSVWWKPASWGNRRFEVFPHDTSLSI